MSDLVKSTTTYKTELVWMLTEEDIEKIRKHDEAKTRCFWFKSFKDKAWGLLFILPEGKSNPVTYLIAHPVPQDLNLATSAKAWVREGEFEWIVSLVAPGSETAVNYKQTTVPMSFDKDSQGYGSSMGVTTQELLVLYDKTKTIGFRFLISSDHLVQPLSLSSKTLLKFFENPQYADTVFSIHPNHGKTHVILACETILVSTSSYFATLFGSNFLETNPKNKRPLPSIVPTPVDFDSLSAIIKEELAPYAGLSSSTPSDHSVTGKESLESLLSNKRQAQSEQQESAEKEKTANGGEINHQHSEIESNRLCTIIDVHETDYFTYRSMIAHLHTQSSPSFYLASDLLVKLDQAGESSVETSTDSLKRSLIETFASARSHGLFDSISPCSSHAMYRLADRYDIEALKGLSLGFITRSLSVENVSYELFGTLSLDYKEVQKPIFEFFIKNWTEVKKTTAFKKVLEKVVSGEVPKATDLLAQVFDKMKTA